MNIRSLSFAGAFALVVAVCFWGQANAISPQEQEQQLLEQQLREEVPDVVEIEAARQVLARDPAFILGILSKMRNDMGRPMENSKRGIDFGLGRGFSGSQAAKHFLGMAAASFSGGPGRKRKRTDALQYPGYY